VRVVEIGLWRAGPACATILADWGADVIKLEPPAGDPFRGLAWAFGGTINPPFELDNRGKRAVAVDLASPSATRSRSNCSLAPTCS
jgi:crotonobetainyl-CoA:carnitine CoA-transferase CaiB-like acyl-CoA transferase